MASAGCPAARVSFCPFGFLSRLFRRLFLESLQKAFDSGKLQFVAALEPLRERDAFGQLLARVELCEWVVYAKRPFAGSGRRPFGNRSVARSRAR